MNETEKAAAIKQNMQDRTDATAIFAFIKTQRERTPRFWEILASLIANENPRPQAAANEDPMSDEEARNFEKITMPYGQFKDKPIGDVPVNYFANLFSLTPFNKRLRRYVRSHRFQSFINGTEE